jgi:phosphatidylserine/phosphatidylglycerophosphate/cardiolipin synthase-like enzyme/subtilisin family serine protease
VDPALQELIAEGAPDDEVAVLLRLSDSTAAPPHARLVAQFGNIATCRLRRADIVAARASAPVISMKAARLYGPSGTEEDYWADELDASGSSSIKDPTAATHTAENKPIIEYASSDGEASLSNRVQNSDIRRPENVNLPTGKGAVVAHIDWGVDITHPDFRLPDGRTRLLALWDQRGAAFPDRPNRYGYGRIFGRAEINRALLSGDPYGALGYHPADFDTLRGTHGTHTLSIAAGNGRSGGASGIAPDADLIFVHLSTYTAEGPTDLGDSVAYFEAIDFVLRTASAPLPIETSNAWNGTLGDDALEANSDVTRTILRPVVVNSSLGRHGGPHVGLTLVEQGLDAALRESPGRAFVHSTGNYYNRRTHASGTLRPGEVHTLQILVEGGSRNNSKTLSPSEIEIWYPGTDRLAVSVTAPNSTRFEPVRGDQQSKLFLQLPNETSPRAIGHLYHRLNDPNNGDNEVVLFLYKGAPVGTYDITLSSEDIADGRYHLWIERNTAGQRAQAKFEANDSRVQFTTGTICNGFRTIAVGAYDAHAWYQDGDVLETGRPLAPFSSSGPTRDGRQKPDLCAPGVNVLAARSSPRDWSGKAEGQPPPLLTRMSGTSMAAPHVTGTIALMFEAANRLLTIEETRRLLLLSTDSPPADSTDSARLRIGSGFLNIEAAITATRGFLKTSGRDDRLPVKAIQSNVYVPATENVLPFQETLQPMNPSYETNEVEAVEAEVDGFYPEYYPEYYPETDENGNDVEAARDDRQQPQRARSRRNGDSPSFGFVLPLGGNGSITPALSVPIGGRQSPFSVAIPLGGTNPPSPSPPPNNSPPGQAPAPSTPNPYANPYADPGMFTAPMGDPYIDPMLSTGGYTPAIPVGVDDPTALPLIYADEFVAAGSDKSITPMVEWSEWDESSDQTFGEQISNVFYESDTDEFESDESEEAFGERIASVADILAADPQARSFRSSAHLATLLDAIGQAQTLSPLGMVSGGHRPSASELYNAFVHGDTALRSRHRFHEHYAHRFLPVAMPGSRLQAMDLRPGDVVVRVARGENWGQFSIIASPRLLSSSELGGSPLGGYVPGGYVPVIECLPVPRLRQDNFVRRLTGTDGKTLPDTLILRVRRSFGEDWNAETENGGQLFRDGARPVVLARGASGMAVRQVQSILNRYSLQELEAGRLTLDGCPLEEDGKFGALMQRAVRDFQMRQFADDASQWDGIVGARTWGKLDQLMEGNRDLPPVIAKAESLVEVDNAPTRSDSARMEWQDLSKVRGHDGVDHLYYLTTGNSEGLATFNLRVTNTNDHYNFNNVVLKIRLSKKRADGTFLTILLQGQKGNYKSIPSQSIADESSRIIPIQIERKTLIEAYNADPDSPFTRLEVEFHWTEGSTDRFASYYYNRTSLSFYLVKPFEFLFNTKELVRRVALNDSQYRHYWTGIWEHEFTAGDKTPIKLAFTIQTALSESRTNEITLSNSATETKGIQRGLETTSTTKAGFEVKDVVKIGLEQDLSIKNSVISSESLARQFSESLRSSQIFTQSFTTTIQINSEITSAAPGSIKKVYLYPVFNLYKLKLVRFEGPNNLGQATQRKEFDNVPILLFSNWGDKQVQTKPRVKQRRKVDDTEADDWAEGVTHTADLADSFFAAIRTVATTLQTQPQFLLAVMNSESSIRASAHNPNGHASGLIQFMPDTLRRLGWTQGHEAFRRLTSTEQMPFVLQYYLPFVRQGLNSTARLYQATFLPATLGRGSEPNTVIVDVNNNDNAFAYTPNRGFDRRSDGRILVGDLTAFVERAKGSARWREAFERLQASAPGSVPSVSLLPPDPPIFPVPSPTTTTHPLLRRGARGEAVREAQTKLNIVHNRNLSMGIPGLQGALLLVDGSFGVQTYNATVSFQRQVFPDDPREWDGVIGSKTWAKLDAVTSGAAPPVAPPTVAVDRQLSREQVMRWFVGGTDSQGQPMGRVTSNNRVSYLIRGRSTFDAMMRAMRTANVPGHFIYLLGWWLGDDFPVSGGPTIRQLFTNASRAGVQVRAMLWDQPLTQNTPEVDHINALSNGAAILDNRTLNLGSHHQKILIVNGSDGLYAFCGGVDINPDRIGNPERTPGYPMHDVHCQIQGPAAFDLLQIFQQRWNDHPAHVDLDRRKGTPPMVSSPAPIPNGQEWVQIGRTFGNGNAHRGIDSENLGTRTRGYTFLSGRAGEQTVKRMILHAIGQARQFIYLEDQYLVSLEIRDALIRALPNIQHLTILIPDGSISDLPQGNFRRREFIAPLRAAGGSKVRVFHPYPPRDPFGYVHSKMWVFDDEYAIIGSANCNRRGYTHDSEVVAGICGQGSGEDLRFAHRLRIELWALHLNMNPASLVDGLMSAAYWLRPVGSGRIAPHDENVGIETIATPESWNNIIDPDGS